MTAADLSPLGVGETKDGTRHLYTSSLPVAVCGLREGAAPRRAADEVTCLDCLRLWALDIATAAHLGQNDTDGNPHLDHVRIVADAVRSDPKAQIVALLHDVIEDNEATDADWLRVRHIPEWAIQAVVLLSRPDFDHEYADYVSEIVAGEDEPGALARLVKRADALHNLHRSVKLPPTAKRYHDTVEKIETEMTARGEKW